MRRAERLFRLVNEMRTRHLCRADDLAGHFEVCVRTIYRDIAHLQASGLPIEGEAGVGYMLRPGFDLPSVTFTYDQIDALAVGLAYAQSLDDPALAAAAREARAKLQASLPQPEARKLADAPYLSLRRSTGAPPFAGLLRKAIRLRQIVQLTYQADPTQRTDRRIHPLVIWSLPDAWMLSGWCELRQGFRTFRLDRIAALTVTAEIFADDAARGLQAFLDMDECEARAT